MSNIILPEDIIELINSIIANEKKLKQEQESYDEQMERSYIYDDYYECPEEEKDESTIIEIQI